MEKCLRNSRRGAAPGPFGMCAEHLKPLLDRESDVMAITTPTLLSRDKCFRCCGSCPFGSDDRIAKARRRGVGHRGG